MPGVIIGHNDHIAWGVTNLHYDVQDLYIERMNLQTGQYAFAGKAEQARLERELIPVKGEAAVPFENWVTRHGPVWSIEGQQPVTLKWIAAEPGAFEFPFLDIDRAENWEEFTTALKQFPGPGQNFVYADIDGNIGYQATGKLPIRATYDGDVPADGSSGENEWQGYIPFEELPRAYNPPSGMIVTANQNPFPSDYKYRVNGNYAPQYRSRQIRDLLTKKTGWKPEEMLAVQKDVYSPLSHFLAQQVVSTYDKRGAKNDAMADAVAILREWNGQMEKDQPAPFLASLLYQHLRRAIAERASPGKATLYTYNMAGPVLEYILRERPDSWFTDYDRVLMRALVDSVEEGRRIQGKNVRKWKFGDYQQLTIKSPVAGQIPWFGQYFNIGPVPMSGSTSTVKQTTERNGPSMRFIADLSNWDQSLMNLTIGQSGQFLSGHFKDQWDEYYVGKSFPMSYKSFSGDTLTLVPMK
jgi:penicillin amidase